MSRRAARENAFRIIYSSALMREKPEDLFAYFEETHSEEAELWVGDMNENDEEYMKTVVRGTCEKKDGLNEKIAPLLVKWDLSRLPKVNLAILQLAVFEIDSGLPKEIAVNEAVELAKKYGEDSAPSFVNATLRKYSKAPETETEYVGDETPRGDGNTDK